MIGAANGYRVSITGLGTAVPERVLTNDELAQMVDTSDEWIVARTGIHERRVAAPGEALSDFCLPAARDALKQAGVRAEDLDLVIIATVTPDMAFPATAALVADQLGATKAGAYDLSAGCTGFVYADRAGLRDARLRRGPAGARRRRRPAFEGRRLVGPRDLRAVRRWGRRGRAGACRPRGLPGLRAGRGRLGGMDLYVAAGGSRKPASSETVAAGEHFARMNGREVFKFATRVLVSSAHELLDEVGLTVEDIDVYVPHQANIRIITHAAEKLGFPEEKVVVNVDRYGNTSSARFRSPWPTPSGTAG